MNQSCKYCGQENAKNHYYSEPWCGSMSCLMAYKSRVKEKISEKIQEAYDEA